MGITYDFKCLWPFYWLKLIALDPITLSSVFVNIVVGTKDMKIASLQRNIKADRGKSTIPKKKEEVFIALFTYYKRHALFASA